MRIWRVISVILLMLVFPSSASAQSYKPSPRLREASQPSNIAAESRSQRGTEQAPLFVKILQNITDEASKPQETDEHNKKANTDWWLMVFTSVIAGFTVVLAISTSGLWYFAAKQSRDVKKSIEVWRQSADAAKKSADALVAVELPIFIIEKINISKNLDEYSLSFGNHGRTPAIITGDCFELKLEKSLAPTPRYPLQSLEKVELARIVEKGHEYKISRKPRISEEDWNRVIKHDTILWVYGYIDYLDFLKIERRDGFCIALDPIGRWVINKGPTAYTYSKPKSEIEYVNYHHSP